MLLQGQAVDEAPAAAAAARDDAEREEDDAREREQQERVRLQVHELKDQWERRKDDPAHRDKPNRVFAMQAYLELCQLREENNDSLCWEPRSLQDYLGAIPHIPRLTAQTQNR